MEKKIEKKNFGNKIEKKFDFFSLLHPSATHECPQKNFRPICPAICNMYINVLFYYIDKKVFFLKYNTLLRMLINWIKEN